MRWAVSISVKPEAAIFCSAGGSCSCARGNSGRSAGFALTGRPRWSLNLQNSPRNRALRETANPKHQTPDKHQTSNLKEAQPGLRAKRWLWLLLLLLCCFGALGCGPFFPNMMLVGGDRPVFTAPVARFHDE